MAGVATAISYARIQAVRVAPTAKTHSSRSFSSGTNESAVSYATGKASNHGGPARRNNASPSLRWHDLRYTCAGLSLEVNPNLAMVQHRLGHEDIRTTINIYGHLLPSVEAALAEGLSATFNNVKRSNVVG